MKEYVVKVLSPVIYTSLPICVLSSYIGSSIGGVCFTIVQMFSIFLLSALCFYGIGLTSEERNYVMNIVNRHFSKFRQ